MKLLLVYSVKERGQNSAEIGLITRYVKGKSNVKSLDVYEYVFSDNLSPEKYDQLPTETIKMLHQSDAVIFEMSRPSQTLGFLLALSVFKSKPTLYLYNEESKGKPGKIITDNPSRLLQISSYSKKDLNKKLDSFISSAERKVKTSRLTFVGTKEINSYLNLKSEKSGLSKGELIRSILEKSITEERI